MAGKYLHMSTPMHTYYCVEARIPQQDVRCWTPSIKGGCQNITIIPANARTPLDMINCCRGATFLRISATDWLGLHVRCDSLQTTFL